MNKEGTAQELHSAVKELYYGAPNKKCHLSSLPASQWEFSLNDLQVVNNNYTRTQALKNKAPLDFLGKDYQGIYVPCTPASEILIKDYVAAIKETKDNEKFISKALIKVPEKGEYEGYTSGKRSCVINSKGRYYRLKGCGNLDQGFPIEGFQSKIPNSREVRGCQFYATATREQYMTEQITGILAEHKILCGNRSVGFWLYPGEEEHYKKLGIVNACPRIDKFCGVFETLGEKRLATHLLQGVEVLLHFLVDEYCNKSFSKDTILGMYPEERLIKDDPSLSVTPLSWLGPFLEIPEDKNIAEWTQEPIYPPEAFSILLNLNQQDSNSCPYQELLVTPDVNEVCNKFLEKYSFASEYKESIQGFLRVILQSTKTNFIKLISWFYARIGWECGKIKRILQDHKINWGYYADHNVLYHCNAHPNNFIILPQGLSKNLLAPLDFDLAFNKENFINIQEDSETYGKYDERTFDTFLNCERYSLEEALSGEENMANFGYSLFKLETQNEIYPLLKTALRDTCVFYYRKAYDKLDDPEMNLYDAKTDESIYALINLALIITKDIIV